MESPSIKRIFANIRSNTDKNKIYSVWIGVQGKEIVSFGCTCKWGSFFSFSKKNGNGTKPCCHVEKLKRRYKKIIGGKYEEE